jgi:hypothetical protein
VWFGPAVALLLADQYDAARDVHVGDLHPQQFARRAPVYAAVATIG